MSGALVLSASRLEAQTTLAVLDQGAVAQENRERPLERIIELHLERVTLAQALDEIASKGRISLSYADRLVDDKGPVTIKSGRLTVQQAVEHALRGTNLQLASHGGRLTIVAADKKGQVGQGTIVGRVINAKTRLPVSGATVTIGVPPREVSVDEKGAFRVSADVGEHMLHIRALGHVRQSKKVTVTEGETVTVEVVLDPSASVLDEVVVTGSVVATERKAIATPITVITADDIEKRGITRIEQLFRGEVPGVLALEEGSARYANALGAMQSTNVFARGASTASGGANPLKTYIDGVEILDPAYLGTIDPKSIERLEIITGPQAATIYGSGAMGGVMQIFTKKGNGMIRPELTVNVRYGMLETNLSAGRTPSHAHNATIAGGLGGAFSYSANLSYNYTGQWQPGLFTRTYAGSIGATHTTGPVVASGSASVSVGRNGTTGNGGYMLHKILNESGEWWQDNFRPVRHMTQQINTSQSQTLAFNLDYRPTVRWHHRITLGRNGTDFGLIPSAPVYGTLTDTLYRISNSYGQRTTASYSMTFTSPTDRRVDASITLGASGSWGKNIMVSGCQVSSSASGVIGCTSSGSANVSIPRNDESLGGFGQWRLGILERLYLTLGLRGEHNPNYGDKHKIDWTPTNGLSYVMEYGNVSVKLLGSYGRATRAPLPDRKLERFTVNANYSPASFVSTLPNPNLRPERSRGPQGGLEVYYGNRGSLSINRYSQIVSDLIQNVFPFDSTLVVYIPSGAEQWQRAGQYQNVAKVKQQGWETSGTLQFGAITANGTYSWADSRVLETMSSSYVRGQSFWGLPSHAGTLALSYAYGGTSVSAIVNYIGKSLQQYIDDGDVFSQRTNARLKMYIAKSTEPSPWRGWVMPGYAKSNLVVSHRLTPAISATVNVTNLGNSYGNDVGRGRPSLGRQTLLGLSFRPLR